MLSLNENNSNNPNNSQRSDDRLALPKKQWANQKKFAKFANIDEKHYLCRQIKHLSWI